MAFWGGRDGAWRDVWPGFFPGWPGFALVDRQGHG